MEEEDYTLYSCTVRVEETCGGETYMGGCTMVDGKRRSRRNKEKEQKKYCSKGGEETSIATHGALS